MLFSRVFALSCDKPRPWTRRSPSACSLPRRSRRRGFVPTPAAAQSMSKTEAILGGPSALEALKAQQAGICRSLPARRSSPASLSYSRPNGHCRDPARSSGGQPRRRQRPPRHVRQRRAAGRPHAARCPLAPGRAWRRSAARPRPSPRRSAARMRSSGSKRSTGTSTSASSFTDDDPQYGRADVWSSGQRNAATAAAATARIMRSPSCRCCAAPGSPSAISIWWWSRTWSAAPITRSWSCAPPATCTCSTTAPTGCSIPRASRDYRPVLTFAAGATWTHGYRRLELRCNIASSDDSALTPAAKPRRD